MNQPLGEFGYNMMPGLGAPMLMGPEVGLGTMGGSSGMMGSMGGGSLGSMGGFPPQFGIPGTKPPGFF